MMTKRQYLDLLELKKEIRTRKNLKRKKKLIILLKLIMCTTICICIFSIFNHLNAFNDYKLSNKSLSISSDDTLWKIAKNEKENNKYFKNKDVREIVYEIKNINNLDSSIIVEGQEIQIPVYYNEN